MKSFLEFFKPKQKPILFLSFAKDIMDLENNNFNIENYLTKNLGAIMYANYSDVVLYCDKIFVNTTELKDFALVFIGVVGDSSVLVETIKTYCKNLNVSYIEYGKSQQNNSKLLQTLQLSNNRIPNPKTIIGCANKINIEYSIKELNLPIVTKPVDGSKGRGVVKNDTKEQLVETLSKLDSNNVILQEFVPNDCDYRVLFIKDDLVQVVKRTAKNGEFRHNVSLGGTAELVTLPDEAVTIARKAHNTMGFFVSGVDLIQNTKTNEWFVLEINAAPQLGMYNVETIFETFVKYINLAKA